MSKKENKSKFGMDLRILAILLLLSAAPLLAGSWWLFKNYEDAYLESVGSGLSQSADTAFGSINNFFQNQIIEIAGLTEVPSIREAVERSNQSSAGNIDSVKKQISEVEAAWPSLRMSSPLSRSILDNPAARFLNRYTLVNRSYSEIMVTDARGRLVAASEKTTDYYQGDEEWWLETFGDGRRGAVYLGDVVFDDSAKTLAMELAEPIVDPDEEVIGIIKVILGAHAIDSIVGSFQAGPFAKAVLLRTNGEVVAAAGHSIANQETYPAIQDILNARNAGRRYFISSSSPEAIYGMSGGSFPQLYPRLNWLIVTTGSVSDILGPLPRLQTYFVYFIVVIFLMCIIATLLVSRLGTEPILKEDPHLERL